LILSRKNNPPKETVPLAVIYKKDGYIHTDLSDEGKKGFELLGYLKCLVNKMEEELTDSMGEKDEDETGYLG